MAGAIVGGIVGPLVSSLFGPVAGGVAGTVARGLMGESVQDAAERNRREMDANSIATMDMSTHNAIQSAWTNVATAKINDSASAAKSIHY